MKSRVRTVFRVFLIVTSVLLTIAILATILITAYLLQYVNRDINPIVELAGNDGAPSRLYYVNDSGEYVEYASGELSSGRSTDYATLDSIPLDLQHAFIAIEDKRFYSHIGFDPITTAKAVLKYVFQSGSSPGGSTITQQLIKNLTGEDDVSIKRKVSEIMRAVALEKELSKDAILELYLNSIYLSQGIYGVKSAAQLYFNKDVSELTLLESAAIAAITQAPTKWDPIKNPDNNKIRRNTILSEMFSLGYITEQELNENYNQDLTLNVNQEKNEIVTSSWYTDAVINESIQLLSEALDVSSKAATHYLYNGGYRITIAVNPEIQNILESYYKNKTLFSASGVQSSFVVIDPQTGGVLGLVGGLGEKNASRVLNRATQTTRSPGSSIKPLSVYLPALDKGIIHYGSALDDVPIHFGNEFGNGWPVNADRIYNGLVCLEYAVAHSLNTVSVDVLEKLGIDNAYHMLETLGISTLSENDKTLSALALGGMNDGVTLLELTAAYTALANQGVYTEGVCVFEIADKNGNIIVDNKPEKKIAAKEGSVEVITKLLQAVIQNREGTAYGAVTKTSSLCDVAGKTGTTSNNHDRWFVGYTPYAVAGIWVGYDEPASLQNLGTKDHIRVWDSIMSQITEILQKENKSFSDELLVEARYCKFSGKIATDACYHDPRGNAVATGYFTKDTVPSALCDTHIMLEYCNEGKGIAGNACPPDSTTLTGLILVNRTFPTEVIVKDAEYTAMLLDDGYLPYYHIGEPYYKNYVPNDAHIGKSSSEYPYNRFCTRHIPSNEV